MTSMATSWEVRTTTPSRVASAVSEAASRVRRPAAALVFLSGTVSEKLETVGDAISEAKLGIPIVVASGSGVLTERGEIEDESAASGIVWAGGRAEAIVVPGEDGHEVGESLVHLLRDRTGKTSPTVLLFANPERFGPATLMPLRVERGTPYFFGAGTVSAPGAVAVSADGVVSSGTIAFILRGIAAPVIRTSHSCRMLAPLKTITRAAGSTVFEIDGEPALDVLGTVGSEATDRPLLLTVLAYEEGSGPDRAGRDEFVIRGVQGVDPDRRSLVVSDEVREGMRITFGVRDSMFARDDLEAVTRELERDIAGAAPRFGLYMNCGGRGFGLYGTHDVDTRILKGRFRDIPIAGMQSSFEIAPYLGKPTLQLYTGVLALFTAPS